MKLAGGMKVPSKIFNNLSIISIQKAQGNSRKTHPINRENREFSGELNRNKINHRNKPKYKENPRT